MKPGLAQSSVPRSAQCVALKVVRSCLSPLRFVAVVAVVALVTFVSVVTGLITIGRGDHEGRPYISFCINSMELSVRLLRNNARKRKYQPVLVCLQRLIALVVRLV